MTDQTRPSALHSDDPYKLHTDDPYKLQTLLSRRSFLNASALTAGALMGLSQISPPTASARPTAHASLKLGADAISHPPNSLTAQSVLSEDHFLVKNGSIDPKTDEVMAYSRPDGQVEAILLQNGTVSQVYRDPTATGGWSIRPVVSGASDVVAGVAINADGKSSSLHVFYRIPDGTLRHLKEQPPVNGVSSGQFTLLETLNWTALGTQSRLQITTDVLQNLLVFYVDQPEDDYPKVAFYWTAAGYLGADPQAGILSGSFDSGFVSAILPSSAVVSYAVSAFGGGPTLMLYVPDLQSGAVNVYQYAMPLNGATNISAGVAQFAHQPTNLGFQVFAINYLFSPGGRYLPMAVVTTVDNKLYTMTHDFTYRLWRTQPLTLPVIGYIAQVQPSNISLGAGNLLDTNNLLNLFCLTGGRLSVIRQVNQGNPQQDALQPAFNLAVPLQGDVAAVASQARPSSGDELIAVGTDGNLQVLTKSADGGWTGAQIHLPADEPAEVSTYRVQLTLTDDWSAPVPLAALSVKAEFPAAALVDGQGVTLSDQPITVTTDGAGQVTIALIAEGLLAPKLTIGGGALPAAVTVSPSEPINHYMAGSDGLNFLPAMSGGTLSRATTSDGKPLFPIANQDTAVAGKAATLMAGAAQAAANPTVGQLSVPDLSLSGSPARRRVGRHQGLGVGSPPHQLGGPVTVQGIELSFSDLTHDALHAIKTGVVKVVDIAVDWTTQWVATITADFDAWAAREVQVVINGIEDAAHVFHAVITQLEAALGNVIDWLKAHVLELLHDTVTLARHFDGWLLQTADEIHALLVRAKAGANGVFGAQKAAIANDLAQLKIALGSVSIDSLAHPSLESARLEVSGDDPSSPAAGGPSSRWLMDKLSQADPSAAMDPSVSDDLLNALHDVINKLDDVGQDFLAAAKDFGHTVTTLVTNPKTFGTVGISSLIDAFGHVIDAALDLADLAVDVVIDLLLLAIDLFKQLIAIPVNSLTLLRPLLRDAGMTDDLTIGRVTTLGIAFPVALAWKVHKDDFNAQLFDGVSESLGVQQASAEGLAWATFFVEGVASIFDGFYAFGKGATNSKIPAFFTWNDLIAPVLLGGLSVPAHDGGVPFSSVIDPQDYKDWLTVGGWLLGTVPGFFMTAAVYASKRDEAAEKIYEDNMLVASSAVGVLECISGVLIPIFTLPTLADATLPATSGLLLGVSPALASLLTSGAIAGTDGGSAIVLSIVGPIATIAGAYITLDNS